MCGLPLLTGTHSPWLEPNNHQPVVGHKFQFRCDPGICGFGVTECEVLETIVTTLPR